MSAAATPTPTGVRHNNNIWASFGCVLQSCPRQPWGSLGSRQDQRRTTSNAPVSVVPTAPSLSPWPCRARPPSLLPPGLLPTRTRSWKAATAVTVAAAAAAAGNPHAAENYGFDTSNPLRHPLPNDQPPFLDAFGVHRLVRLSLMRPPASPPARQPASPPARQPALSILQWPCRFGPPPPQAQPSMRRLLGVP